MVGANTWNLSTEFVATVSWLTHKQLGHNLLVCPGRLAPPAASSADGYPILDSSALSKYKVLVAGATGGVGR